MTPYAFGFMAKGSFDQADVDKVLPGIEKVCNLVQRRLSTCGKPYIAGTDQPTIADIKAYEFLAVVVTNPNNNLSADLRKQLTDLVAKYPLADRYLNQTMKKVMGSYVIPSPA